MSEWGVYQQGILMGSETTPNDKIRIHILDGGLAFCGMPNWPGDWPKGHVWTGVREAYTAEVVQIIDFGTHERCAECYAALAAMKAEGE